MEYTGQTLMRTSLPKGSYKAALLLVEEPKPLKQTE